MVPERTPAWQRVIRAASIGGMVAVGAVGTLVLLGAFPSFGTGIDERMYREATLRWLGGGPFYLPHQVAGPYVVTMGDVMYPPIMLALFVPLALLPPQVWYALPIAIMAASLRRLRPRWWVWPILLVMAAWPWMLGFWLFGNPKLWIAAGLFLLVGRSWRWWLVAGIAGALLSLAFLPMWPDYLAATRNAVNIGYAVQASTWLLLAIPVVAWLGSRRWTMPHALPERVTA